MSGTYTHGYSEPVLSAHRRRTAAGSAPHLLASLVPGSSLLDVGSGPGTITVDLAERVAPGRVVGVEVVPELVAEGRRLAEQRGVAAEFVLGDVRSLDLADDSFDVVHAHQVLQHLSDPVGALREMARVCRPGGLVAVRDVDYAATTWFPADDGLDRWLSLYSAVARGNGAEPDAGRRLLSWARAAGLEDVTASTSTWTWATPEDRRELASSWAQRVVSSGVAEQALAAGLADGADLEDLAAAWHRWAASPDGWLAMLHGELLVRVR